MYSAGAEVLKLTGPRPLNTFYGKYVSQVYQEALSRQGIGLEYTSCAPLNCARLLREGRVDGHYHVPVIIKK